MKLTKNTYFIVFVFSLLSLFLGITFMFMPSRNIVDKHSDSAYFYIDIYWKAYWRNPLGTKSYGTYQNSSGDLCSGVKCGYVYLNGYSYSGASSFTAPKDVGQTDENYANQGTFSYLEYRSVENNTPIGGTDYSFKTQFGNYAYAGFYLYSQSGDYAYDYSGT